jgi:hypothetical protein
MGSGHIWSEMGNVWIFTPYGFAGCTYKQNVERIFHN